MHTTTQKTFIAFLATSVLISCGTTKNLTSNGIAKTAITITAENYKKAALQEKDLQRWSHLDIVKDTVPGMSVDRAYAELLNEKKSKPVIVAILDSGIDIEHEDLKNVLWTNTKEIANNGIDDDKNGYIDDIHGWNFLGNITKENLEYERILKDKTLVDEATFAKVKALFDEKFAGASQGKAQLEKMAEGIAKADDLLVKYLKKPVYTPQDLEGINTTEPEVLKAKNNMQRMFSFGLSISELKAEVDKELKNYIATVNGDNLKTNYRNVLGDNPNDIKDTKYGNNNVIGPDKEEALHGTHVAGIVAASRNNNLGGDGIANNVKIMALRAVPDGDEYDKDIALGIRYAVDNGAKVINCSFGKPFSPQKQWVYDAIKYAEKKDVLIVHGAGNDGKDIDKEANFPNDSDDKINEFADNFITIGALNFEYGDKVVADFSNYGKINVDVFAPGVQIYATTPNNTYKFLQGTSMASPNAAGVAALIRSYYPKLSAKQVKQILIESGVAVKIPVAIGGDSKNAALLDSVSKSGKMINAYNALIMAATLSR